MIITRHSTEAEWLADRYNGVGASEAAIVVGASRWSSPWALYESKVNRKSDFTPNEMSEAGHRLEPCIAQWFEDQHPGTKLHDPGEYTIFRSETHPQYCTPDRTIGGLAFTDKRPIPLELKCAFHYKTAKPWETQIPPGYQVQLMQQIDIMESDFGYFTALLEGYKFRWYRLNRNDRFIVKLRAACSEFWDRVQNKDPPSVDASDDTRRALQRYYDEPKPERVDLSYELWPVHERLQKAKATIKKLATIKTECENTIKAAIGDKELGILHDCETAYHWRPPTKTGARILALKKVRDDDTD